MVMMMTPMHLVLISLFTVAAEGKFFIGLCSFGFCEQECKQYEPKYKQRMECFCRPGFVLKSDGRRCIAVDDPPPDDTGEDLAASGSDREVSGEDIDVIDNNCDNEDGDCDTKVRKVLPFVVESEGEDEEGSGTFEKEKEYKKPVPTPPVKKIDRSMDNVPHVIYFSFNYPRLSCIEKLDTDPGEFREILRNQVALSASVDVNSLVDFKVSCSSIDIRLTLIKTDNLSVRNGVKRFQNLVTNGDLDIVIDGVQVNPKRTSFRFKPDPTYKAPKVVPISPSISSPVPILPPPLVTTRKISIVPKSSQILVRPEKSSSVKKAIETYKDIVPKSTQYIVRPEMSSSIKKAIGTDHKEIILPPSQTSEVKAKTAVSNVAVTTSKSKYTGPEIVKGASTPALKVLTSTVGDKKDVPEKFVKTPTLKILTSTVEDKKDIPVKIVKTSTLEILTMTVEDKKDIPDKIVKTSSSKILTSTVGDKKDILDVKVKISTSKLLTSTAQDKKHIPEVGIRIPSSTTLYLPDRQISSTLIASSNTSSVPLKKVDIQITSSAINVVKLTPVISAAVKRESTSFDHDILIPRPSSSASFTHSFRTFGNTSRIVVNDISTVSAESKHDRTRKNISSIVKVEGENVLTIQKRLTTSQIKKVSSAFLTNLSNPDIIVTTTALIEKLVSTSSYRKVQPIVKESSELKLVVYTTSKQVPVSSSKKQVQPSIVQNSKLDLDKYTTSSFKGVPDPITPKSTFIPGKIDIKTLTKDVYTSSKTSRLHKLVVQTSTLSSSSKHVLIASARDIKSTPAERKTEVTQPEPDIKVITLEARDSEKQASREHKPLGDNLLVLFLTTFLFLFLY